MTAGLAGLVTPPAAPESPPANVATDEPGPERQEPVPGATSEQRPATNKEMARAFSELDDPDPAVSSELERAIQRAVGGSLDRGRFDLDAVICRANVCQIFVTDLTAPPVRERPDPGAWGPVTADLRVQLADIAIPNPRTGATVGNPQLKQISFSREGGGIITMFAFDEQH